MRRAGGIVRGLLAFGRARRILILLETGILMIVLMFALANPLLRFGVHGVWDGSGLGDVALFTVEYRFADWAGEGMDSPPAYDELMRILNDMDGATAESVDYDVAMIDGDVYTFRIYPVNIANKIETPLSFGEFPTNWEDDGVLPVVLDSRARSRYSLGDDIEICGIYDTLPESMRGKVVGFLNEDNDHIATRRGSNVAQLESFVEKALGSRGDDYLAITVEHPLLADKPFLGARTSILLFPDEAGRIDEYAAKWDGYVRARSLGQVDSYSTIYRNDIYYAAILEQLELYLLCVWVLILVGVGMIGYCMAQARAWDRQFAVYGLLGMEKRSMIAYLLIAGYLPFLVVVALSAALMMPLLSSMYPEFSTISVRLAGVSAVISLIPCLISLIIDIAKINRMQPLTSWREREAM